MSGGSIARHLLMFSLPLLIGNVFQQRHNTVDSIVVGNYVSKQALAAVDWVVCSVIFVIYYYRSGWMDRIVKA